jgi:hypothetical protein
MKRGSLRSNSVFRWRGLRPHVVPGASSLPIFCSWRVAALRLASAASARASVSWRSIFMSRFCSRARASSSSISRRTRGRLSSHGAGRQRERPPQPLPQVLLSDLVDPRARSHERPDIAGRKHGLTRVQRPCERHHRVLSIACEQVRLHAAQARLLAHDDQLDIRGARRPRPVTGRRLHPRREPGACAQHLSTSIATFALSPHLSACSGACARRAPPARPRQASRDTGAKCSCSYQSFGRPPRC